MLVPDSGTVFVPPHLRVLHVTAEPYFVNESLKDNLFFGYGTKDLTQEMWDRGPPRPFQQDRVCLMKYFAPQIYFPSEVFRRSEESARNATGSRTFFAQRFGSANTK